MTTMDSDQSAESTAVPDDQLDAEHAELAPAVDEAHGDSSRVGRSESSVNAAGEPAYGDDGDVGADFIEEFLDLADLDGDIEIDFRNGRSYITVTAPEGSSLSKVAFPEAVSALQDLARLAIETKTGARSRLVVDVSGSRDARTEELRKLVDHAIEKIEQGASSASLPPMTSYDRKLVHDFVAERGYVSDSLGEGDQRYPVISKG